MLKKETYLLKIIKSFAILILLFSLSSSGLKAQETDYKAYSLYVYNFMKYIEWTENQNQGDFVIVIFGKSNIQKELQKLAFQKKIRGRNIVIKSINKIEEINDCDLLYLSSEKSSMIKEINLKLTNKSSLVVGEKDGLAKKGAALSFATLENDELSFDINKKIINQQKLKISNSLIKLGSVVVE
ncbi:MAG: YfiR family protein [Bacteroidota bacterium]